MLVDASVARSFAVIGWTRHLIQLGHGSILVADGVHGQRAGDPSELRSIRNALQRQADQVDPGSGFASRALAAVHGLDQLLALAPNELTVVTLSQYEFEFAVRLQSRRPEDREWRRSLGAKSRRLDAGESASIAIAARRSLAFASDDEDALTLWNALTRSSGHRTRDLLRQLVISGVVTESDAHAAYRLLQADETCTTLAVRRGSRPSSLSQPPKTTQKLADTADQRKPSVTTRDRGNRHRAAHKTATRR